MGNDRADRPPFTIRHLDHVVIRTANLEAMLDFYRGLGCELVRRVDHLGLHQLRAGASIVDLVEVDKPLGRSGGPAPGADGHNMDHLALAIEPFDRAALHDHFDRLGVDHVDPSGEVFGAEGLGPALYVTDPDGNTVELKGPPSPDQPS